jgi:hypothetical protein
MSLFGTSFVRRGSRNWRRVADLSRSGTLPGGECERAGCRQARMSSLNPAHEIGQIMTYELDRSGNCPNRVGARPGNSRVARLVMIGLLSLALVAAPSISFAGGKAEETGSEAALGAAAVVSSLIYGPVKLVYATGGLLVGAFAWAFTAGDTEVAEKVFTRSLRGTYVITPDILTGEQELVFIGRDVNEPSAHAGELASSSSVPSGVDPAPVVNETIDGNGYDETGW